MRRLADLNNYARKGYGYIYDACILTAEEEEALNAEQAQARARKALRN